MIWSNEPEKEPGLARNEELREVIRSYQQDCAGLCPGSTGTSPSIWATALPSGFEEAVNKYFVIASHCEIAGSDRILYSVVRRATQAD